MSLSDRFAKISTGKGGVKGTQQKSQKLNVQVKAKAVQQQQKGKRTQAVALKRGTGTPVKAAISKKGKSVKSTPSGQGKVTRRQGGKGKLTFISRHYIHKYLLIHFRLSYGLTII